MRNGLLATLLIGAATALTGVASAAPGDLDPSFNGTGKLLIPPIVEQDKANDMLIQPDGKIVLVGSAIVSMGANGRTDYAVRRLNPNGSPDTGFGTGGLALVDFDVDGKTPANSASAVALQPDGKIVVVGSTGKDTTTRASAARLNKDGSLDNSFGPGGDEGSGRVVLIQQQEATDVAVDSSGRILVAGPWTNSALFQTGPDFSVTSLNGDGSTDKGFNAGSDNPVRVSFGAGPDAPVRMVVQPDGRIVLAGFTVSGDSDAAVTRVVPGTGVDAGFGTGGKQTYGFGAGSDDSAEDVLIEPGGKIDVAGFGTGADNFTLTRLTAAGQLDNSLNGSSTVDVDFGGLDSANAIALQSNGKIVLAGDDNGHDFAIARIQPGGALDSTFGAGGKTTVNLGDLAQGNAMALQADGRIVIAGTVDDDMVVIRLQGDSAAAGGAPSPGGGSGQNGSSKVPRCAGHRATIVGTAHRDRLKGTRRADVIVALGGNDTVDGGGGNDIICGGAGNDSVKGGSGSDKIYGEAGNDKLSGGAGNDKMSGGAGNDALSGGAGKDAINGGSGKDKDNGGSGKDSCAGKDSEKSC